MKQLLTTLSVLSMSAALAQGATIVDEKFDQSTLDTKVWNHGTGFRYNAGAENATLTTFDGTWGSKGDQTGAAGLNSKIGSASFMVKADGENSIGGNFNIGKTVYSDTKRALVRIDLSVEGAGTYEVVWNNSGSPTSFKMASGWSGTVAGNSFVWIVNGNNKSPHWGKTDDAEKVSVGDAADRFGFWHSATGSNAVIDDLMIADTTVMAASGKKEAPAPAKNP